MLWFGFKAVVRMPMFEWDVPDHMSPQKDWFGGHLRLYLQHYETVHFDLAGLAPACAPMALQDLWSCCQWHRACFSAVRRMGWSLPARCAGAGCWILSRRMTAAGSRRGGLRLLRWGSPRWCLWREEEEKKKLRIKKFERSCLLGIIAYRSNIWEFLPP